MKKTAFMSAIGLSLLAGMSLAHADGVTYDIGANVGTLGFGPEIGVVIVPDKFAVRLTTGFASFNTNQSSSSMNYSGSLDLRNAVLFGDYHPFAGSFRLTGGLALNDNSIGLSATPTAGQIYSSNGHTYVAGTNDHANASIGFNKIAPYLGIGFGSASSDAGLHFTSDFGLMYMGSPTASLSITTSDPAAQSTANQYAASAQSRLNADMAKYKLYPVAQIGAVFRF